MFDGQDTNNGGMRFICNVCRQAVDQITYCASCGTYVCWMCVCESPITGARVCRDCSLKITRESDD